MMRSMSSRYTWYLATLGLLACANDDADFSAPISGGSGGSVAGSAPVSGGSSAGKSSAGGSTAGKSNAGSAGKADAGSSAGGDSGGGTAVESCDTPPGAAPEMKWVNATGNLAKLASECGNLGLVS